MDASSLATLTYEVFTGKAPTGAGMDYLVAPDGANSNNLNSAYYQSFSLENRYINFAANLGKVGEGATGLAAKYGGESLFDASRDAYQTIFSSAAADAKVHLLFNPTFQVGGGALSREDFFAYYGQDGAEGICPRTAILGWLLCEAAKAPVGVYAQSTDAF